MADFTALKTAIQNAIKQNGNEEITGNLLQEVLLAIVTTLGDGSINDLVTALGSEATTRSQADGTLQQNINAEAQARQLGDSTLQGGINSAMQAINAINNAIGNGCVYAGIATPSTTPAAGKVFYLALTAGTYINYGGLEVPQGINILKNNGSTWSLDSFLGIDDAPAPSSNNLVKSGGVLDSIIKDGSAFDLSAYNGGATYADLNAALTALNALPAAYKRGGMSMKFVLSSDNKYMQYRLMNQNWSTTVTDWQGIDDEPTAGSENLVKSGSVFNVSSINKTLQFSNSLSEKTLEADGSVAKATAQKTKIDVYRITDLVGETLDVKGYVWGNFRLWSVFSDEELTELISTSPEQGGGWGAILEKESSLVVQANMNYLCVLDYYGTDDTRKTSVNYNVLLKDYTIEQVSEINDKINEIKEEIDVKPDYNIICWGDSLTVGNQDGTGVSYPSVLASELNINGIKNCGIGGEASNAISIRQGGNNIVIPAGNINGTYTENELTDIFGASIASFYRQTDYGESINPLNINGYEANISYSNGSYTISGYSGPSSTVPLIARCKGSEYTSAVTIIFAGTNGTNLIQPWTLQKDMLPMIVDSMISHLKNKNYIIMGMSVGSGNIWDSINTAFAKYGNKFFPTRDMLVKYGLTINGLTPTSQDLDDIENNKVPSSLLYDSIHLNHYGYNALGILLANKIRSLGYDKEFLNEEI